MGFAGTYEMTRGDNYEEFLKEIGVGLATRKIAAASRPTVEIQQDGDNLKLKTTTTLKTIELVFTLGIEFTEETEDGRKAQTLITADGDKLIQVQKLEGLTATTTRTFSDDGLDATFQSGNVVSRRSYKRTA
ncbi:lipocalin/fatty-acid binding family protein [Streptomyces xanthochromogenes]|uniref:lipocalin/fatty-acid binding family protein n=1 Tax=Streptomyces xanthochromogenes TaxID=67384 RepID=UPI00381A058F